MNLGMISLVFVGGAIFGAAVLEAVILHHERRLEYARAAEVLRLEREVRGLGKLLHD